MACCMACSRRASTQSTRTRWRTSCSAGARGSFRSVTCTRWWPCALRHGTCPRGPRGGMPRALAKRASEGAGDAFEGTRGTSSPSRKGSPRSGPLVVPIVPAPQRPERLLRASSLGRIATPVGTEEPCRKATRGGLRYRSGWASMCALQVLVAWARGRPRSPRAGTPSSARGAGARWGRPCRGRGGFASRYRALLADEVVNQGFASLPHRATEPVCAARGALRCPRRNDR
jgi:hypothetical protein